jgi:hypothetical protein
MFVESSQGSHPSVNLDIVEVSGMAVQGTMKQVHCRPADE